jgi:hypothetical protein
MAGWYGSRVLAGGMLAVLASCDTTEPEAIVTPAIVIDAPSNNDVVNDTIVRVTGVARVPKGGSVVLRVNNAGQFRPPSRNAQSCW